MLTGSAFFVYFTGSISAILGEDDDTKVMKGSP